MMTETHSDEKHIQNQRGEKNKQTFEKCPLLTLVKP